MYCSNCGSRIERGDLHCPHCGAVILSSKSKEGSNRRVAIVVAVLAALFVLFLAFIFLIVPMVSIRQDGGVNAASADATVDRTNRFAGIESTEV